MRKLTDMAVDGNNLKAGEFRGRVVTSLEYIEKEIEAIKHLSEGNQKRIGRLERKLAWAAGIATAMAAAAGFVSSFVREQLFGSK